MLTTVSPNIPVLQLYYMSGRLTTGLAPAVPNIFIPLYTLTSAVSQHLSPVLWTISRATARMLGSAGVLLGFFCNRLTSFPCIYAPVALYTAPGSATCLGFIPPTISCLDRTFAGFSSTLAPPGGRLAHHTACNNVSNSPYLLLLSFHAAHSCSSGLVCDAAALRYTHRHALDNCWFTRRVSFPPPVPALVLPRKTFPYP